MAYEDFLAAANKAGFSTGEVENIARHTGYNYDGLAAQGLGYLEQLRGGLSNNATMAQGDNPSVYGYSPTGQFVGNAGGPVAGMNIDSMLGYRHDPTAGNGPSTAFNAQEWGGSGFDNGPRANTGGLGGLGGMPTTYDPNMSTTGPGSGPWGNFGGNTSPVYRPNQGQAKPQNGWGGAWGGNNPFSPTS